ADPGELGLCHGVAEARLVLRIEEEEASAARPDQLAAECPVPHGEIVPTIDRVVAHPAAAPLLMLPVHVHQLGEAVEVSPLERLLALEAELLGEMQVLDHGRIAILALLVLLPEDAR